MYDLYAIKAIKKQKKQKKKEKKDDRTKERWKYMSLTTFKAYIDICL